MKRILCPRCRGESLELITDGYYRCQACGYTGLANFDKEIFNKSKK